MVLDIALSPLALETQTFVVGDVIRVTVSFKYVVGVNKTVKIFAGPYATSFFHEDMVNACIGQTDVPLEAASEPREATATVDFTLLPRELGGIKDGIYGLKVWIEGTNAVAKQENVIVVTGNTSGSGDMFSSMMPMIMMLMMMGMVMPMTQQMREGAESP